MVKKIFAFLAVHPYLCIVLNNKAMTLVELLDRAKFYHKSANITRLVKQGSRIVFYGGMGDESQFAIELGIKMPIIEQLHMELPVRAAFVAELGVDETYNQRFPLIATMNLEGEQYQIPVSSPTNFETWFDNNCPKYNFFKQNLKWSVLQMDYNTPQTYKGKTIFAIFLTRTIFEI